MIIDLKRLITKILERLSSHSQEIDELKTQNVLWSGAILLSDLETVTLSELVSEQHHGIILVFSHYNPSNSRVDDYGWCHFFVPKSFVASHPGEMSRWIMHTDADLILEKAAYISDASITGTARNASTATINGYSTNNRYAVLRYVIGV